MFLNKKIIPAFVALNIITLPLTGFSQESVDKQLQGPFPVDFYQNGKIYLKKDNTLPSDVLFPYKLFLEYNNDKETKKEKIENQIDKNIEITLVTTYVIDNKPYLFIIGKRYDASQNETGYQYFAYVFSKDETGELQQEVGRFVDELQLDGFDGIQDGKNKNYPFKTAESLKKYLTTKLQLSILQGPFKTSLYPTGQLYFYNRKDMDAYPINFTLKYQDSGKDKQELIDLYEPVSGGGIYTPATINSVFTYSIQQKSYIFVIVSWDIDFVASAGGGSSDYKIYSYTKNNNGLLKQDKNMIQNPQFSGSEGNIIYSNNEDHDKDVVIPVKFNYTTADALKKYLDQTYNFAIIQGPFETVLYPEGKIYFQAQESGYQTPVNFVLEYNQNGQPKKETIDQYKPNHVAAEIASVFTYPIHQKPYIFTIVKWSARPETSNGRYGYFYKVYGYTKDQNNNLKLDQNVSNDPKLSGFIGANIYKNKEEITFKYETAGKLKKYLNQKYNKSLSSK